MWKYQQTFGIIQSWEWILKTFKNTKELGANDGV